MVVTSRSLLTRVLMPSLSWHLLVVQQTKFWKVLQVQHRAGTWVARKT